LDGTAAFWKNAVSLLTFEAGSFLMCFFLM